jgi:carbonic anhydrase/acetyltransferase-like protein (isoleucine patch superfamily)
VRLGAIVVIGLEEDETSRSTASQQTRIPLAQPLACLDVLGHSTAERIIEHFVRADIDVVSVLSQEESCGVKPVLMGSKDVEVQAVGDLHGAIYQQLKAYSRNGVEHAFVVSANDYVETDLLDLFYFHRESLQTATQAIDREGPLNLWVVDCLKAQPTDGQNLLAQTGRPSYFIREYVNRLNHPRDLRQFAVDLLRSRCAVRPPGREIKRGVWIDDDAEVHRRARVVAPAYIGRASRVMQDTVITRCSNVEKDCCVDYGTVVENSSILQNTHVGICLDVCHAVANGNTLLSLGRNVVVEIADPSILRKNSESSMSVPAKDRKRAKNGLLFSRRKVEQAVAVLQPAAGSSPEPCRPESDIGG